MSIVNLNLNSHYQNTSNKLNRNTNLTNINTIELELNRLWGYFIRAFEFEKYYEESLHNSPANRIKAIKMLNEFFIKNKIFYSDNYNIICSEDSQDSEDIKCGIELYSNTSYFLLKQAKVWIMYIVIMSQTLEITDLIQIFKNSLTNNVDQIFLFEFFLIFLSKYNKDYFMQSLVNNNLEWPLEFIQIYKENKFQLNEIFGLKNENEKERQNAHHTIMDISNHYTYSFDEFSFYTKDTNNESMNIDIDKINEEKLKSVLNGEANNTLFAEMLNDDLIQNEKSPSNVSRDKFVESNKSPTLDNYLIPNTEDTTLKVNLEEAFTCTTTINKEDLYYNEDNLLLIDKNFKEKNHFAIFILVNKLRELYSEQGDKSLIYMITPIKKTFDEDIYEKLQVQKELTEIRNSAYNNFVYFPYSLKLIELINFLSEI
jgi:hypothetical protein